MLKYQFKTILKITGVVTTVGVSTSLIYKYKKNFTRAVEKLAYKRNYLPTREQLLHNLKSGKEYDILIVGGGATGAGIALDAISRGLSTALVEKNDYSSGTSSRSTKLIHGGVRYLQKAIMSLDYKQFLMVREALSERANLLEIAPHLAQPIPIILPLYKLWHIPYYWAGIKMYDIVSLTQVLKSSYFMNKKRALEKFPVLNKDKLVGAIVYYDGQHDDSRMCLSILLTSIKYGADMLNYCNVESLLKDKNSKVVGASVVNSISGEKFDIKAKVVINATGAYTDSLRKMDNKDNANICRPSSGIHIVLPNYYRYSVF
ncbi:hypothetical protein A3Q56_07575 [Intoshia linei]|uniref:Glycerol-3-phosphate dehydrogenase n=1 Tax=Intoshia linei TaxID=1819745 RepID=A0A177AU12_9BILA|nr:hypothetical protein A3Q56_07575 [Intoshia linei]